MDIFTLVGRMTIDGLDKTKTQLTGLEKNVQKAQKGMKILGAAFTAVGAAGLAIVQSTKKINAQLGVTAINLGITTKEMRDLTLATTNVTFPIDEVTASFDLLARAGVKDQKVLKDTAIAFDTLGDATGYSASQVTGFMVPAMKTFGLTAIEMAKKTDIMTYMSRESTMTMEDFNTMVGYTTPELVKAGLTMDDLTAALIYMERQGYAPGRVMTREFMKATTLATKEQIPLTEALGMTSEELKGIQEEFAGTTGMTEEYAEAANKQYTLMDKLKQKWSEITLGMSGFLEPLEPVLAGMTALGPLMIALSTSAGAAAIRWGLSTAALIAHTIAAKAAAAANWLLHASMGPVGWVIAGISVALIAAIPFLTKATEETKELTKAMSDLEQQAARMTVQQKFTAEKWDEIIKKGYLTEQEFEQLAQAMDMTTEALYQHLHATGMLEQVWADEGNRRIYVKNLEEMRIGLEELAQESARTTDEIYDDLKVLTGRIKDELREQTRVQIDAIDDQMNAHRVAHQERMDQLGDEYDETIKTIDAELSYALQGYQSQLDAIDRQIEAIDDAQKQQRDAERKAELEASIATETDADRRADLEDQLNDLLIESGNAQWQKERELALEARIAEEKDVDERKRLESRLAEFLLELQRERTRKQLDDEKDAIRQRMNMARDEAKDAKNRAQESYDYEQKLQEQALDNLISQLEGEKEALDSALEKKLKRYDNELAAFTAMLGKEEEGLTAFIATYNALVAELKDVTAKITIHEETIKTTTTVGAPGAPPSPTVPPWTMPGPAPPGLPPGEDIWWYQKGGIFRFPQVIGVAERGPEAVIPLNKGMLGGSIYIDIHDNKISDDMDIEEIGRKLVDKIRLRTGVRI